MANKNRGLRYLAAVVLILGIGGVGLAGPASAQSGSRVCWSWKDGSDTKIVAVEVRHDMTDVCSIFEWYPSQNVDWTCENFGRVINTSRTETGWDPCDQMQRGSLYIWTIASSGEEEGEEEEEEEEEDPLLHFRDTPLSTDWVCVNPDESDPGKQFILISTGVLRFHGGCEAFGRNGDQFQLVGRCSNIDGECLDADTYVIVPDTLELATAKSTCVQLEGWGNSPYGYDYVPNSICLFAGP